MTEIRFPLGRQDSRADVPPETADDPLAEMAHQIKELDAAAERVADRIGALAGGLRDGQLTGAHETRADLLAGLAAALVDRTSEIREDCAKLSALMARTVQLVAKQDRDAVGEPDLPATEPAIPAGEDAADAAGGPVWLSRRPVPAATDPTTSEGVRLIATQMAIAGSPRSEIERRLRIQFGVRDADQALDEIFGTRRTEVG